MFEKFYFVSACAASCAEPFGDGSKDHRTSVDFFAVYRSGWSNRRFASVLCCKKAARLATISSAYEQSQAESAITVSAGGSHLPDLFWTGMIVLETQKSSAGGNQTVWLDPRNQTLAFEHFNSFKTNNTNITSTASDVPKCVFLAAHLNYTWVLRDCEKPIAEVKVGVVCEIPKGECFLQRSLWH